MRPRELSTRVGLIVYTALLAIWCISSWSEESDSVPVAVHASCMAAVSVHLLEARPTLHCAMLCSLLCWTGLLTAGGAKFDQKALSSTHALGAALEYSAGLCSRSSTRVRSPSLHQRQRIQRSAAASHRHCCSSSNPLLCFCATHTGVHLMIYQNQADMHDAMHCAAMQHDWCRVIAALTWPGVAQSGGLLGAEEIGSHVLQVGGEVGDVAVGLDVPGEGHLPRLLWRLQRGQRARVVAAEEQLEVQLGRVVCVPRLRRAVK